jgi:adenine/guanine phosphoribosyltransferase-like PRPP-binding protein
MASVSPQTQAMKPAPVVGLATTNFWQRIEPASDWHDRMLPPYSHSVPVSLPGGEVLALPIRVLPQSPGQDAVVRRAVASLIANQASLSVAQHLATAMGKLAQGFACEHGDVDVDVDAVVGLPTLGMTFAPQVAQALGHTRWVPLGYSRKFWYDDALSMAVESITTPGAGKRIYLDPNQLVLVRGKRVLIVDDAVSSGRTLVQTWDLLTQLGVEVLGAVVAMRQGNKWRAALGEARANRVQGVFDSPLLVWRDGGWWPAEN